MGRKSRKKAQQTSAPVVARQADDPAPLSVWPPLLVALLAVTLYLPTLHYDFVLDDYSIILENSQTRSGMAAIPDIFRSSYRAGFPIQGDELYRPLPKTIFAISWDWFGENPFPLHLLNVLLYALCCLLLWLVLQRFTVLRHAAGLPAFAAATLFAAHPTHTEVVANIKSLDELLAMALLLLSLYWFLAALSTRSSRPLVGALPVFFLALLSKESSITFLAIYPLAAYVWLRRSWGNVLLRSAWFLVPAAVFLIIRFQVVASSALPHPGDNLIVSTNDGLLRKTTAIAFLGRYLWLLLFPHPLSMDYSFAHLQLVSFRHASFWLSLLALSALLAAGIGLVFRRRVAGFGIMWFFITISLTSNVFVIIGTHFAERLLFMPSAGFTIMLAALATRLTRNDIADKFTWKAWSAQPAFLLLLFLLLSAYSVLTWNRIGVWKNNLTLFESGIRNAPNSYRTHYYLGQFLTKKHAKKYFPAWQHQEVDQRGLAALRKAITIMPTFTDAWLNIGNYYSNQENWDSAAFYYRRCIELDPSLATAYNNLATALQRQGHPQQAIEYYQRALQLNPEYLDALRNMGSVLGMLGRYREAIPYFERVVKLAPGDADGHYFLGITYRNLGMESPAEKHLSMAARLNPDAYGRQP